MEKRTYNDGLAWFARQVAVVGRNFSWLFYLDKDFKFQFFPCQHIRNPGARGAVLEWMDQWAQLGLFFGPWSSSSLSLLSPHIWSSPEKFDSRYGSASLFLSTLNCSMDSFFSSYLCNSTQPILQRKVSSLHPCDFTFVFFGRNSCICLTYIYMYIMYLCR